MARPIYVTVGAATNSQVVPLDHYKTPFNVSIGCGLSAGASLTYTVQYTYDNVQDPAFSPATATWYSITSLASKTSTLDGNIAFPVTAVRLNVSVWASGTVTMAVIQAGINGA
jgi:hypothetical protein